MIKYFLPVILLLLFQTIAVCQTDAEFDNYLSSHKYVFHLNNDSTLSFISDGMDEMLLSKMKGKSLFVYGEGWSHGLHMNAHIINAIQELFSKHGLKMFFIEAARSWVVSDNIFFHLSDKSATEYYPNESAFFRQSKTEEKKLYRNDVQYCAVDFERPFTFPQALNDITVFIPADNRKKVYELAPYFLDTTYRNMPEKEFVQWYKKQQLSFFNDSVQLQQLLGKVYPYFRYLMSDPQPFGYHDDRNKQMANHLMYQIGTLDSNAKYFYDCGIAHSRPGKRDGLNKTAVHRLAETRALKGRIVVMNLYGENCNVPGSNGSLKFMRGRLLQSFNKAMAENSIVVFDLADLQGKYKYIPEKYGELLVFVKGQR